MNIVPSPYADDCADEIARWPATAAEARSWAGDRVPFPITPIHIHDWHEDPDVHPFVAHGKSGTLVAYGELWVDREEGEIELARIIVHPRHRGVGIGRAFVTALVELAAPFGIETMYVRVVPENVHAQRCYASAGFIAVPPDERQRFNREQSIDYVWLKHVSPRDGPQ